MDKGGRPLKFNTPQELEQKAEEYLSSTPNNEWTITGLALALDTTRQTLVNYENRDEFLDTVKKLKTKVENSYELGLRKRGGAGDIFGLKNFGWSDKIETEHSGEITQKQYIIKDGSESSDISTTPRPTEGIEGQP